MKLWALKVARVLGVGILGLPLGSPRTKNHLDVALVERCRVYYKGENGGFPQVRVVLLPITWAIDVQMTNARAFSISTFQDLSNDTKNAPIRGVLGLAIEL
jgi:hypothetical protein